MITYERISQCIAWSASLLRRHLGPALTISGLLIAIWFGYTQGYLSPPRLLFGFGASRAYADGNLKNVGLHKDGQIHYMVVAADSGTSDVALVGVPFYLKNDSPRALHNITVQISYPRRLCFEWVPIILNNGNIFSEDTWYKNSRTVEKHDDYTVVEYKIDILRPGEGLILEDLVRLNHAQIKERDEDKTRDIDSLDFKERLSERLVLYDAVKIQAFVLSAETQPMTQDLTLVFARGAKTSDVLANLGDRVADAAWGRYRPHPGVAFKFPWQKSPAQTEFFELSHITLSDAALLGSTNVSVENTEARDIIPFSTAMPIWDVWNPAAH